MTRFLLCVPVSRISSLTHYNFPPSSDTESRQSTLHFKALPSPVQEKVPMTAPEEVVVTVEDLERAMVNL